MNFSSRHLLALSVISFAGAYCGAKLTADTASITIDDSDHGQLQVIDGFGTCGSGDAPGSSWYQSAYFDDMGCSIMRMDLTPQFKSPYSDLDYNSPWFGQQPPLKIDDPANPGGPEHNYVRTYTGPDDYTRAFGATPTSQGTKAQIAVMGPDIDKNIQLLDFTKLAGLGAEAQAGLAKKDALGDFKLYASLWSPAPWVKIANGQVWGNHDGIMPATGTPYPFIWGGNFAGGKLDTSDTPLPVFDDGNGPTSALTQFARCLAAYLKGFQDKFGVKYYAISIQNEINFPEFYNSCVYRTSDEYIKALKAARKELDSHPDLKDIKIVGPEDLLGGDATYGMWQLGGGDTATHKNLQYVTNIEKDPEASAAENFYCIHGYANDGATAVGSDSKQWRAWAEGWKDSPAPGIPPNIDGFSHYHKKSWMTETSGEDNKWISPASGFPGNGAWSIALKMQQALTVGQESACLYWQFDGGANGPSGEGLTASTDPTNQPKYVAVKHFVKYIRPGAFAVKTSVTGNNDVSASSYVQKENRTLTIVLVNKNAADQNASIQLPDDFSTTSSFQTITSSDGRLWQESSSAPAGGSLKVTVPGYGVVTLYGPVPLTVPK